MAKIKLASWNVNGIRAISKRGFADWLSAEKSQIVSLQETKIDGGSLTPELSNPKGFKTHWCHAEKKGYSGTAIFSKTEPKTAWQGMGNPPFDTEGRVIGADYGDFTLLNIYYPNGKSGPERLQYKLDFYDAFLQYANTLRANGKKLVICGDFNTAHKPIDLSRPKDNEAISGFLPVERAWMDQFVASGYIDTFRLFSQDAHRYSWWSMRTAARDRNVGWRIDYFFVSDDLEKNLTGADIQAHVQGSDHCPVTLELRF